MPKYPNEIYPIDLSELWKRTKEAAKKKAADIDAKGKDAAKTQAKEFSKLDKEKFNLNFASNLAKWPTLFPDYKKMKELYTGKIQPAIDRYTKDTGNSKLDDDVKKILVSSFNTINSMMKKSDAAAKALDDKDLASKQASGKIAPSIVVLKHPDILDLAVKKAGGAPNLGLEGACPLEIVINDKDILKKFPDDKEYANQAQKIKDKADFAGLVDEIAQAIKAADKKVAADPSKLDAAKADLQTAIDKAIKACAVRATDEAGRQAKLKGEARWANVKSGLKLTLTGAGVAVGATAIALTPFTAGVSTIAGCIGLSKSIVELTKQIYALSADLNTLTASAAKDIKNMKKGYDQWLGLLDKNKQNPTSWEIGLSEFGKRGANALLPTWVTTIKSVKEKVEACEQKCNNIEVRSNSVGEKLSKMLAEQAKADKAVAAFIKSIKGSITPKENDDLVKLLKTLIATEKSTGNLIDDVTALNKKVSDGQTAIEKLSKDLKPIDAANPVWSEVSSTLFETTASLGYMFLAASGAPEPYDFAKEAKEILEKTHEVIELVETTVNLGEGLHEGFKKKSKR